MKKNLTRASLILSAVLATGCTSLQRGTGPDRMMASEVTDFVTVKAGRFRMGSPGNEAGRVRDEKLRSVAISHDYEIQKTEVTQAQWFAVMGNNPSRFNQKSHCPETHMDVKGQSLCPKNPVESVSWSEIQEFIGKLNANSPDHSYRLPTEAEWEYAARAGTGTPYSFSENTYGNQVAFLPAYAWYRENSAMQTHEVASKKPNPIGLYDVHGNVREFVQDWYESDLPSESVDPVGPSSSRYRVVRGGGGDSEPSEMRSAKRYPLISVQGPPEIRGAFLGFRLVREIK